MGIRKRDSFQKVGGVTYGNMLPIAKRAINIRKNKEKKKMKEIWKISELFMKRKKKVLNKSQKFFQKFFKITSSFKGN